MLEEGEGELSARTFEQFDERGIMPCYRPENGVIETERLRVVSLAVLKGRPYPADRRSLERDLGIHVPEGWPPLLLGRLLPAFLHAEEEGRAESTDMAWLLVLKGHGHSLPVAVGLCGFLAPPDPEGKMEIRYAVMDDYKGRGLATEGATAVVSWAFLSGMARTIIAQTGKDEFAAMRVLAKLGFILVSKGHGDTFLFERQSPFVNVLE